MIPAVPYDPLFNGVARAGMRGSSSPLPCLYACSCHLLSPLFYYILLFLYSFDIWLARFLGVCICLVYCLVVYILLLVYAQNKHYPTSPCFLYAVACCLYAHMYIASHFPTIPASHTTAPPTFHFLPATSSLPLYIPVTCAFYCMSRPWFVLTACCVCIWRGLWFICGMVCGVAVRLRAA